jgi:RNA polymerase sigma-70 factor (ECF subfamily)
VAHPFDLARLFAQHRDELQRFAQRRLGNREAAADLVQDTFVRFAAAMNGAPGANGSSSGPATDIDNPRAFLFRITGNLASDALRHDRVVAGVIDPVELNHNLPAALPSPEVEAVDRDLLRRLQAALAQLPEAQRRVLALKRVDGLSHAEIARRTGMSPAAIEKTLARGLRRLRELLDGLTP